MDRDVLAKAFRARFGEDPEIVSVAPGRINLIGEHTDYNGGFVFPVAIDRALYVAAGTTDGPTELYSLQLGDAAPFDSASIEKAGTDDWGKYVAGMAWALRPYGVLPNLKAVVQSEIPIGSGVSSSAAMELGFGVLYQEMAGLKLTKMELALLGQKAENEFVGVKCGIMDQMASALGRDSHAIFIDTRSLDIGYAPIPSDLAIVLCDTKTPRALTSSSYNQRRSQCEEAARVLDVPALRDATLEMLEIKKGSMSPIVYRRARHVITENMRCELFVDALAANHRERIGQLMRASHESLRDDYEVSSRELDLMAESAWGSPGCVGARMTGAGFGGACVALIDRSRQAEFSTEVNTRYENASGHSGDTIICRAVDGAHVISRG